MKKRIISFIVSSVFLLCINYSISISAKSLSLSSEKFVGANNKQYIPVLMYHNLVDKLKHDDNGATMSADAFKSQMKYLKECAFNTITFSQLEKYFSSKTELPNNPIIITFDDGYESNYKYAYPILKKLNMKANIDIIVSMINKKNKKFSYLTGGEIKKMSKSGIIEIGSHTYNLHSKEHLEKDIKRNESIKKYRSRLFEDFSNSKKLLKKYNIKTDILSLPYGYKNPEIIKAAKKAGFKVILTTEDGVVRNGSKLEDIPRIFIGPYYTPQQVVDKIIKQASFIE